MIKPKKFDLEITFKLNNAPRTFCVNIKTCPVCWDTEVFARVCQVCGRFSKTQRAVFLQVARDSPLHSIPLQDEKYEANIPEPKITDGAVIDFKRPQSGDGEPPKAS